MMWGDTLITNLPADGCVEVACLVDRNGIQPTRYGALPPLTAAVCSPAEIEAMTLELFNAEARFLPGFR